MKDNVIIDIAYKYLSGMSLRDISKEFNTSHITIRKKLKNKLPLIDRYLYQEVMDMMNKKISSLKDEEIQKRILRSYSKLVDENKLVEQIANEENTSYFTTYRDLTVRLKRMNHIIDEQTLEKMNELVLNTLKKHSAINLKRNK